MMKQGNLDLEGSFKQKSLLFNHCALILAQLELKTRYLTPFTNKQPDNTISIINSRKNSNA